MTDKIKELVSQNMDQFIAIRRHIHQHPELSFKEFETHKYLCALLDEHRIPYETVVETGIIATIEGKNPQKKTIVLRGDIDALPIIEKTDLPFSSENEGVMHACGHDVHSSTVMSCGILLNQLRQEFEGTVILLFQPGEEKLPGGASKILATGKLQDLKPSAVIGQHVFPEMNSGKLGFRPGMYMASADEIYIDVKGPGGHAALPERTVDLLNVSAQLIQRLQDEVYQNVRDKIPTVLTFGHIEGRGATNVIPKIVHIEGTFRTMNEDWRREVHERMRRISVELQEKTGAEIDLTIVVGYPCLINHEELTEFVKTEAKEFLGADSVEDLDMRMTSEDFSFYTQEFDSCFYRLGVKYHDREITNLHTPEFDADENSMETGISFMTYLALRLLQS